MMPFYKLEALGILKAFLTHTYSYYLLLLILDILAPSALLFKNIAQVREAVKYYFADFVRKESTLPL